MALRDLHDEDTVTSALDATGTGFSDVAPLFYNHVRGGDLVLKGIPSFTSDQAAREITRDGLTWNANEFGKSANLTYSFLQNVRTIPSGDQGFVKFNDAQIQQAKLSLQSWADVANLTSPR